MFSGGWITVRPKSSSVNGGSMRLRAGFGVGEILPTPAPTPTPAKTVDSDRLQLRPRLRLRSTVVKRIADDVLANDMYFKLFHS